MGLKPRYLTSNFFAKIANSCSNLISIITCSIANVSICLYPSLPVEWGAVVFLCWREQFPPYKFSRIALTRSKRPLGCTNFWAKQCNLSTTRDCSRKDWHKLLRHEKTYRISKMKNLGEFTTKGETVVIHTSKGSQLS